MAPCNLSLASLICVASTSRTISISFTFLPIGIPFRWAVALPPTLSPTALFSPHRFLPPSSTQPSSMDAGEGVAGEFETYEDYLDSQITETDLYYLEDEELARQLVVRPSPAD